MSGLELSKEPGAASILPSEEWPLAMSNTARAPGRDRRLRRRLFDAGNTSCPICLSEFARSDAVVGKKVTLEHAPPKALGGAAICLTCNECNNRASLVDQHAFLSKKARDEWSAGRGAPIVVDLFGHKRSYRFIPRNPNAPFPARKHLMRNGSIELDALPPKESLDAKKGISFRIPQRDDYELVSMVKSAYLMVFSLMGANGYRFARNVGLRPVREQIMNPGEKILKGGFVGEMRLDSEEYRKLGRSIVFLCRATKPPFWIVPLWNDKVVFLSCGAEEPIDELVMNASELSLPTNSLAGWVSRRFNGSSSLGGTVAEGSDIPDGSLAGTVGGPLPTSQGNWLFATVFHQMHEFVALPLCPENDSPPPDGIHAVDMLSKYEALGGNLDISKLASTNVGKLGRDVEISVRPTDDAQSPDS